MLLNNNSNKVQMPSKHIGLYVVVTKYDMRSMYVRIFVARTLLHGLCCTQFVARTLLHGIRMKENHG